MSNSVDPDKTAHMSRFIWIYAVCKSLLLSPVAVKELKLKAINTLTGETTLLQLLYLPSEKGIHPKRKELALFVSEIFPFRGKRILSQ